ncbi:hypothetical protein ACS04_32975 [Streptomyces roseus]|uniref:Uncharacterized protein n=1 Tax=Streptomyces roseus TaxID=66430 RepID=A0A0J6XGK3_9ACTN|nr:hypothetical protein ACS04_32975 [Streptomyces roseus]
MTGFPGPIKQDLRGQTGRAAQSQKPQVLGALDEAGGAEFVRVSARQEEREGGVGTGGGEHRPNIEARCLRRSGHVLPVPQTVKER